HNQARVRLAPPHSVEQDDPSHGYPIERAFSVPERIQIRNDFKIISSDGGEPAFPFGYSVTAVIKNVYVQAQVAEALKIGDQLIGEHGIALNYEKVTLGVRGGELIAPQLYAVAGFEADLFEVLYLRNALRVRRPGRTAPHPEHQRFPARTADCAFDVGFLCEDRPRTARCK